MKIAINGDVINTKKIYRITEIGPRSNNRGDSGYLGFEVYFLNKNVIKYTEFDIPRFDKKPIGIRLSTKETLTNFRDKILEYWNVDKSNIPQVNL